MSLCYLDLCVSLRGLFSRVMQGNPIPLACRHLRAINPVINKFRCSPDFSNRQPPPLRIELQAQQYNLVLINTNTPKHQDLAQESLKQYAIAVDGKTCKPFAERMEPT